MSSGLPLRKPEEWHASMRVSEADAIGIAGCARVELHGADVRAPAIVWWMAVKDRSRPRMDLIDACMAAPNWLLKELSDALDLERNHPDLPTTFFACLLSTWGRSFGFEIDWLAEARTSVCLVASMELMRRAGLHRMHAARPADVHSLLDAPLELEANPEAMRAMLAAGVDAPPGDLERAGVSAAVGWQDRVALGGP
jgi:hypothetical protein